MYRRDKKEFKACIRAAMWEWLDKLAKRMDKVYARKGIKKRVVPKVKLGRRKKENND